MEIALIKMPLLVAREQRMAVRRQHEVACACQLDGLVRLAELHRLECRPAVGELQLDRAGLRTGRIRPAQPSLSIQRERPAGRVHPHGGEPLQPRHLVRPDTAGAKLEQHRARLAQASPSSCRPSSVIGARILPGKACGFH